MLSRSPAPATPSRRRAARRVAAVLGVALWTGTALPASAEIASSSGAIAVIQAPTGTLASGTLESDSTLYAWFESRVTNPGSLSMDHVGNGTVSGSSSPNSGTISPGFVDSYLIHFDPVNGGTGLSGPAATITFSGTIVGVWHVKSSLDGTDSTFAPAGLTYGSLTSRSFELNGGNSDSYTVSGNVLTIHSVYATGATVDELRVLVTPEPSTFGLAALGVLGLAEMVRRRRRALATRNDAPAREPARTAA